MFFSSLFIENIQTFLVGGKQFSKDVENLLHKVLKLCSIFKLLVTNLMNEITVDVRCILQCIQEQTITLHRESIWGCVVMFQTHFRRPISKLHFRNVSFFSVMEIMNFVFQRRVCVVPPGTPGR